VSRDRPPDLGLENAVLRNLLAQTTRAYEEQVEALRAEKELAQTTLASIGDAVITTDAAGRILYLNPVAEQLTGWSTAEASGKPLDAVFHLVSEASGKRLAVAALDAFRPAGRAALMEPTLLVRRDGQSFAVESSTAPIPDAAGRTAGAVVVFQDVSDQRLLALQLAHQASHDPLTGLLNRSAFDTFLDRLLAGAGAATPPHALAYVDLDQFKVVNDTCGHFAGDELLIRVAGLLRDLVRESDVVARLGGDEFGVLLPGCGLDDALARVAEIHAALTALRFTWQQTTFPLGASIGVVPVDRRFADRADLLSAADHACYVAKEKGRGRVQVYQPEDAEFVRRHGEMEWVVRLQRTLEEQRFRLWAQEVRPLQPRREPYLGCELLLRMVEDDGRLHPSSDFVRAAERYGLMKRVDRWVVEHAMHELARLPAAVRDRLDVCAINLSALSLGDEAFHDFLDEAVAGAPLPADRLCFEITETATVENLPLARRLLDRLRRRGCCFALDDFGSGMASYGYLKDLRVDYLKIAGTFVTDMVSDRLDRAMVESIHQIGHLMGITTVGEHVSSQAIHDLLVEIGVDFGQGHWLSPPRPLGELGE
jgi:diguanylate cyclase (GGDEF)-like protein/PAS domain S-box-containing protein